MKARSLKTAEDWRRVQKSGQTGSCDHLRVRLSARDEDLPSRLGLRIRATGPARGVRRNRARRRVKEAFGQVGPPRGYDVVIQGDTGLNGKSCQELSKCLERALDQAMRKKGGS